MKKQSVCVSLMLIAALIAGCGGAPASSTPQPAGTIAPVVDTSAIKSDGKLQPQQFSTLSFATGGEVAEVLVKEGDTVKANDVIARLRSDSQQAAVARAQAGVAVAGANLAQYQEQVQLLIIAAEADVRSAQAQVAAAFAQNNDRAAMASAVTALAQATANQQQAHNQRDKTDRIEIEARADVHPADDRPSQGRADRGRRVSLACCNL